MVQETVDLILCIGHFAVPYESDELRIVWLLIAQIYQHAFR
jgi:hypothetical protein